MSQVGSGAGAKGVRIHSSLPSISKIKQIDRLQIMRAVAVIVVAWGHGGMEFGQRLPDLGIFGIDLFFVISGFILASIVLHSRERAGWATARDFMMRRLIRIYPIYWIYAVISGIRLWHNGYLFHHNYWYSILLLPLTHHWRFVDFSWTMMFEITFYCILGSLLLFTVRLAVPVLIILLTLLVCASGFLDLTREAWAVITNPILLEFVFGATIAMLFYKFQRLRALGVCCMCCGMAYAVYLRVHPPAAAAGMVDILYGNSVAARSFTWGIAASLMVGGMVFWSPQVRSPIGRLGVVIGNASYSIYLGSSIVMEFGSRGMQRLHRVDVSSSLGWAALYQVLLVCLVLLSGWISYQFVEWPLVRSLQRRYADRQKRCVPVTGRLQPAPD